MRTSQYFLCTAKEAPADAEIASHKLLLRAGMVRKLAAGLYTWLPLGLRVLRKVEQIVREEMNRAGALEILMPAVQPAELWQETERWEKYGPLLLKITDHNARAFCFGPTHEEVITDLARREIHSYKQLPINFYQIQTKFRDEIRPRFGLMRAREFVMKDAYSFHLDKKSLEETYQKMYGAYTRIFNRLGLHFRAVLADTGNIGGSASHEFQVLAQTGEDVIVYSDESDYAANIELAEAVVDNENIIGKTLKTIIVKGKQAPLIALVLRSDHELNTIKAEKLNQIAVPLTIVPTEEHNMPMIVDHSAACLMENTKKITIADLRNVVEGDPSPDGKGKLKFARGIEVGHIFQLGDQYSVAMQATIIAENGQSVPMQMGCYGIGISRIVAAAIEQNHDEKGIIWPAAMAPFQVALVPINAKKSVQVQETADKLYTALTNAGFEVLYDDRDERPGVMFADMELIGISHRIVIGERHLQNGQIEYQGRQDTTSQLINLANINHFLNEKLGKK